VGEPAICELSDHDPRQISVPQLTPSSTHFRRRIGAQALNSGQHAQPTVNPVYNPKDATFDFPIYLSLADQLGVLELVIWDKDMLRKEYLGEVALPLEDWFADKHSGKDRAFNFDQPGNIVCYFKSSIVCNFEFICP
jgi:hypothetical protein